MADAYATDVILQLRATSTGSFVDDALYISGTTPAPTTGNGYSTSATQKVLTQSYSFAATQAATNNLVFKGAGDGSAAGLWAFGTNPVTVDFWYYRTNTYNASTFRIDCSPFLIYVYSSDGRVRVDWPSATTLYSSTNAVPLNQWSFISITRSGSNMWIHVNGVLVGTGTTFGTTQQTNWGWMILAQDAGTAPALIGYFDQVRITRGVARYSASNYTPPAATFEQFLPTFPISQQNGIVEDPYLTNVLFQNRGNALTSDVTGTAFDAPLAGSISVSTAITPASGTQSLKLNSAGTIVETGNVPNLNTVGTGAFTLDYWVYPETGSSQEIKLGGTGSGGFSMRTHTTSRLSLYGDANGTTDLFNSTFLYMCRPNTWSFVSVSRDASNNSYLHLNGKLLWSGTTLVSNIAKNKLQFYATAGTCYFDEVRFTKGVARYGASNYDVQQIKTLNLIPTIYTGGVTWASAMSLSGGMYPSCAGDVSMPLMVVDAALRADSWGDISFKPLAINGVMFRGAAALGEVSFSTLEAFAQGCTEASGVTFSSAITDAIGVIGTVSAARISFTKPQIDADGYLVKNAEGEISFVLPKANAVGLLGQAASCDILFRMQVGAEAVLGVAAEGDVEYTPLSVSAMSALGLLGNGSIRLRSATVEAKAWH